MLQEMLRSLVYEQVEEWCVSVHAVASFTSDLLDDPQPVRLLRETTDGGRRCPQFLDAEADGHEGLQSEEVEQGHSVSAEVLDGWQAEMLIADLGQCSPTSAASWAVATTPARSHELGWRDRGRGTPYSRRHSVDGTRRLPVGAAIMYQA